MTCVSHSVYMNICIIYILQVKLFRSYDANGNWTRRWGNSTERLHWTRKHNVGHSHVCESTSGQALNMKRSGPAGWLAPSLFGIILYTSLRINVPRWWLEKTDAIQKTDDPSRLKRPSESFAKYKLLQASFEKIDQGAVLSTSSTHDRAPVKH